ncbi:MAG TPA: adenosylcobinamide-GDP ribazoletransferase [Terriglobia bacterium]|nr:adenosylcobinamide-GDP ribazoletransferase [Terriglobia bacterium]
MTISEPASDPAKPGAEPGKPALTGMSADASSAASADLPGADLPGSTPPGSTPGAAPQTSDDGAAAQPAAQPAAGATEPEPGTPEDVIPIHHLHGLGQGLLTGLGFFTRLPVRPTDQPLAEAVALFSVIGALIGLGATAVYVLGLWIGLSGLMSAILAVAATAMLTGALHDDGLADFADMLGVRGDRARKLAVMRDSTIGTYGTLALVFVNLMKVAALADLAVPGQVASALIAAHALGRGVLPFVMRSYPLARSNGLAVHAGKPPLKGTYVSIALAVLIAGLVGGPSVALVATVAAFVVAFLVAQIAHRQLGGYTGDVLGAAEQLVEVTVILNFVSFT